MKKKAQTPGVNKQEFILKVLIPVIASAVILMLWISARECEVCRWTTRDTVLKGATTGVIAYALAWVFAGLRSLF